MDIDGDVDGRLAQQFGCLGTVDHEILVGQFQQILGPYVNLSAESCRFFLDMNNWNLQAALGSYYDYNAQDQLRLPNMIFIKDVTIGEGESVPPNTKFLKTWRLQNSGAESWPDGCILRHIGGDIEAEKDSVTVKCVETMEYVDVGVEMTSPSSKGIYQSRWQMNTPIGIPFGETIWCIIVVDETGLLSLTQRLAAAHCSDETADAQKRNDFSNPFGLQKPFINMQKQVENNSSPQRHSTTECNVDLSFMALRGSPVDSSVDLYPPESPNGSSSLHAAIAAAFPDYNNRTAHAMPIPVNIGLLAGSPQFNVEMSLMPRVPPCTPCSPAVILQSLHSSRPFDRSPQTPPQNCGDSTMDEQ